jgi:branched-chain amino acid transport system substrate-binding protein
MRRLLIGTALAAFGFFGAGVANAQQTITIATVGPMTGQYASFGEQMRRGAQMAIADINAAGGVLGRQLALEIGDDACDPRQAVAVANQMVSRHVAFVAGHFCSGSSIPASEVYAEERILQISPASTNPTLTDRGARFANVFRVCGRDDQQGLVAAAYIAENFRGRPIAIIHDRSQYGKGLADATKAALNDQHHVTEAMYEAVSQGDRDFTALISRMKAAHIEVMYFGGYHTEAALLVRQARDQGLTAQLISGDALVTQEFWSLAGPAGEGTLMTFDADPRKNPVAAPVVARFRGQTPPYEPEGYTLYTYAAIQVWAQAVAAAGNTTTANLLPVLHQREFQTVLGNIRFNDHGDTSTPAYRVYVWRGGSYDYVNPS